MKSSTFFIVLGMIIISLYLLVDVSYYASAETATGNTSNTPYIKIPKIGVDESINDKSIDYGIYHEPQSAKPGFGTVILFGHRTFYGSPFLNLDKLQEGDNIILEWPGIGNVEYSVVKSFVVPESYRMNLEQGKTLFLITCYPLGSTKQRLIIQASQKEISPFQNNAQKDDSKMPYAILLISAFFGAGTVLSYVYPVKEDKIVIVLTTLGLTLFLILGFLFPTPPEHIVSELTKMSSMFGFN